MDTGGLILQAWVFRCAWWAKIEGASRHPWLEIQPIETPAFESYWTRVTFQQLRLKGYKLQKGLSFLALVGMTSFIPSLLCG